MMQSYTLFPKLRHKNTQKNVRSLNRKPLTGKTTKNFYLCSYFKPRFESVTFSNSRYFLYCLSSST